jgi:deazaflavin-dependent oxidoreductase (nitroreductase family)
MPKLELVHDDPLSRSAMSTSPADFNSQIVDEFRANEGRVGGMFDGMPLLLLHHTGAKSGQERINPLAYLEDGGSYVIFASKGGAPTNPAWYHNLITNPQAKIEVGTQELAVVASEVTGSERDRLYAAQAERAPGFGDYQQKTTRKIPVVALTPAG